MTQPSVASVTIDGTTIHAIGIHFGMGTVSDGISGMPAIGSLACSIAVVINLNDQHNVPFTALNKVFQLAYIVTREKIVEIVLTFWSDDAKQDVICTYKFNGWISNYVTATGTSRGSSDGDATNHILTLTLQPELDSKQFAKIQLGN